MFRIHLVLLALALGAGACASGPAPTVFPSTSPSAAARPPAEGRARTTLQRERTGQKHPSVVVENAFSTAQHVFVDWEHAARVEPRSSATLQLSAGTHTITSAESSDPDDRAVSVTESFEPGFRYTYEIVAE